MSGAGFVVPNGSDILGVSVMDVDDMLDSVKPLRTGGSEEKTEGNYPFVFHHNTI